MYLQKSIIKTNLKKTLSATDEKAESGSGPNLHRYTRMVRSRCCSHRWWQGVVTCIAWSRLRKWGIDFNSRLLEFKIKFEKPWTSVERNILVFFAVTNLKIFLKISHGIYSHLGEKSCSVSAFSKKLRSWLLVCSGEEDPRSPSGVAPRTPITSVPASHDSPLTIGKPCCLILYLKHFKFKTVFEPGLSCTVPFFVIELLFWSAIRLFKKTSFFKFYLVFRSESSSVGWERETIRQGPAQPDSSQQVGARAHRKVDVFRIICRVGKNWFLSFFPTVLKAACRQVFYVCWYSSLPMIEFVGFYSLVFHTHLVLHGN